MSFSLNDSLSKFSQLKKKLRQLTNPTPNNQNKNYATEHPQPHHIQTGHADKRGKGEKGQREGKGWEKEERGWEKEGRGWEQETERKRKKSMSKWFSNSSSGGSELVRQKEQTLNEINELLQRKREILQDIEKQLRQQAHPSPFPAPQPHPSSVRAPDLLQLREQKKQRERQLRQPKLSHFS